MRKLAGLAGLVVLKSACSTAPDWHGSAAAAIGDQLVCRLAEPLARTTDTEREPGADPVADAVESAVDDISLPAEISQAVLGPHSSFTVSSGYATVSFALVLVPEVDPGAMLCMVFAMSTAVSWWPSRPWASRPIVATTPTSPCSPGPDTIRPGTCRVRIVARAERRDLEVT
jgi:hypothetical protein